MSNTGALIVATPLEGDPIQDYCTEPDPHISMLWFGEAAALPSDMVDQIRQAVADVAETFDPFTATVSGRGLLGPDEASVLLLESAQLVEIRALLGLNEAVEAAWGMAEKQFPWWVCHLTTAYDGALPVDPPATVSVGSLELWLAGERTKFPLVPGDVTMASVMVPPVHSLDDLATALRYADENPGARWYAHRRAVALGASDLIPAGWADSA